MAHAQTVCVEGACSVVLGTAQPKVNNPGNPTLAKAQGV